MTVLFNRTLAKIIANSADVTGSCGRTVDSWVLSTGGHLSTSSRSNYADIRPTYGCAAANKRLLKAAPVGAVVKNHYCSNWTGGEYEEYLELYIKEVSGAWRQLPTEYLSD